MKKTERSDTHTQDMTLGNPYRLILLFALPLMAGNVFQQLYTVVDTAIVGQALGVDALAALGAADWTYWLFLGMIQGITQGFAIRMAQNFGAKDEKALCTTVGNSILLCSFCALLLLVIAQGGLRLVFHLLHTPDSIIPTADRYLRILLAGIPIVMLYNFLSSVLRALGDGKTPLLAMTAASLTNIVLDLLFVLGFHWGVAGAAIATLLAQLIASVICIFRLRQIPVLRLSRANLHLQGSLARELAVLAAPMAFQNMVIAVGGMVVQFAVNHYGVAFIAGYTATNKLYGLLEIAAVSYGYAMVTFTGQNIGAGKRDRVSLGIRAGLVVGILTSLVISAAMFLAGRLILSCFISASSATAGEAMEVAYLFLRIMAAFLSVLYILHIVRSCLQGLGNTFIPMISGFSEFIMRVGSALLLPYLIGQNGILLAEIAAWIGADLVLVAGYLYISRKKGQL